MNRLKILRGYLGPYFVRPDDDVRKALHKYSCDQNLFITAYLPRFNEVISYLLINSGRKSYKVYSSFELIEIYVGKDETYTSLMELRSKVLFLTIASTEMPNVRYWDIPRQLIQFRLANNLPTVVITDQPLIVPTKDFFTINVGSSSLKYIDDEEVF